ncbi:GNAT family N-acetyltransferase [Nonomuraea polychroma]|uniref:GNAT family N-acetyltransferase n=1 Tax=Nonomuraea polychroma TaxID=46176 RepID=UPI003D8FD33B
MRSDAALTIRGYRPADFDDVIQLNAYGLQAAGIDISSDYYEGSDLSNIDGTYSNAARGALLVGEIADRIIAMGGIRQVSTETCELLRMRVHPDFQGRGYGTAILLHLEATAAHLGYRRVQLLTGEHQHPAVDLYTNHGYQVAQREILVGIPSIHMIKDLACPSSPPRSTLPDTMTGTTSHV